MKFDHHAFISYAHIDNEPLTPGQKGWVAQFHATLQTMLSQRLGEKARIWRDDKLEGNDMFAQEIVDQFAKTALLISILSPRYVRSEWCTRELRAFCEAATVTGGLTIGNKSRIFKVVKTPVEAGAELPEQVHQTLGYDFFAVEDGDSKELDPAFGEEARQRFLSKLSGLAWQIAKSLQELAQAAAGRAAAAREARPVVFLAECGHDLRTTRDQLATDLLMHGYEVLPAQQLPLTEDALVPELKSQLERCALSIHLVGRKVGPIPDGPSERSLMILQNELAAARCRQGPLRRIIWLPEGVTGERAEQQAFIDALQQDAALQYGADLIRGDLEALKGAIHLTLRKLETPEAPPAATGPSEQPVVHVVMSDADRTESVPLIKLLRRHGLRVTLPVFVGDAAAVRAANMQLVSGCNALVLFYGAGDEVWKFHQQSDLIKQAAASGGTRHSEWICLAAPSTADKEMLLQLGEPNLLDARAGFSDAVLQPLLSSLPTTRPAQ
jgi:hypothetical protein